ncbi:MopE-related protein [Paraliomyxa miuraensis]|uniref:MopE-related protein n=1 Tax=Paraliomyxa miuraensis TaxID=376150 RepID=UPI00225939F3|nr:MopE-related protein [Paraliomyxa miuraensis]MCX4245704.1 MopE-related protein [Paraliomyxa miuraensis]
MRRDTRWVPLGFGAALGLLVGFACATSDQMLEKRRREEGNTECRPGMAEPCYTGPDGSLGRGVCKGGQRTCKDDGTLGECTSQIVPTAELCNGADDDCDGIVDNGFERDGALCEFANAKGVCRTQGKWHCSADGTKSECDAKIVSPSAETCNGLDDDCDGEIDEDAVPKAELECSTGKAGVCAKGTNTCVNGKVRCVQDVQPGPEICNGYDDNCNNQIDDQCVKQ